MVSEEQNEQTSQALIPAVDDPELARLARLGSWLAASEARDPTPREQGMAAALRLSLAQELGLPLRAASLISFVKGRLVVHVELMRALAHQAGYRIERVEESADSCTAAVIREADGRELGRATFTIEQAKRANLVKSGGAYETYPERMLWARAAGFAMRDTIPHVVLGLLTSDEGAEIRGGYADIEGEVIAVDELAEREPEDVASASEKPGAEASTVQSPEKVPEEAKA